MSDYPTMQVPTTPVVVEQPPVLNVEHLAHRVGQLESENAWLRKQLRRHNVGSWVLGLLLVALVVAALWARETGWTYGQYLPPSGQAFAHVVPLSGR